MCRRTSIVERVMARVVVCPETACWVWQGPTSGSGRGGRYPRMSLDGGTVAVHRVMFTHENGYIPPRKHVDHCCRNRLCVNPAHLELTTHKENCRRRDAANSQL